MGGPRDLEGLFDVFLSACKNWKNDKTCHGLDSEITRFLTSTATETAAKLTNPDIVKNLKKSLKKVCYD